MDELNQHITPPPYHVDNPYGNSHINRQQLPPYDQDYGYNSYDNNYNSRVNPADPDNGEGMPYDPAVPPYTRDNGFPHNEDDFNRPFAVSFWVHYFRYIPHLNLSFSRVNDTFNPKSSVYQEVSFMPPSFIDNVCVQCDI